MVPPSESKDFAAALGLAGKVENVDFEKYFDYEAGHGFPGVKAITDSKSRVAKFLVVTQLDPSLRSG
jgi:hypothetical protein